MIKNPKILQKFEDDFSQEEGRLSYEQAMKIFIALWLEAQKLGTLPSKDPLEGIENDIELARILNSCSKKSSQK